MDDLIPSGIWCWLNDINRLPDLRHSIPDGVVYLSVDFEANPVGQRFLRVDAGGHNSRVSIRAVPNRPTRILCDVPHSRDIKIHVYQSSGQHLRVTYTAVQAATNPPERGDYDCYLVMSE